MKIFNGFDEYNTAAKTLVEKKGYEESKGICEKYKDITKEVSKQYLMKVLMEKNGKPLENCQNAVKEQRGLLIKNAIITATAAIPIILIVLFELSIAITLSLSIGIPLVVLMLVSKGFRGKVLEIVNKVKDYLAKFLLTNYVFPVKKISKINESIKRLEQSQTQRTKV